MLFSGRYKVLVVDGSGNGHLRTVCDYVHLNPVWAHLLTVRGTCRASSLQERDETGLFEVMVGGEGIADLQFAHRGEADAIGE